MHSTISGRRVATMPAAASGADARYLAGGQSLIQAMKLRLSQSERLVDLGAIADLKGIKVDGNSVTIGAMTTHAAVAASAEVRRRSRRSPSSPAASATRWCATWARSAARSPTPTRPPAIRPASSAWARRSRPTSGRSPPTLLHRPVRDRAAAGRADHRGELPDGAEGGLHQVQAAGVALRADRRVRRPGRGRRARRRHRREGHVFRAKQIEDALAKSFTRRGAKAVKMPTADINSDLHGSAAYRAAMISVMASRAVERPLDRRGAPMVRARPHRWRPTPQARRPCATMRAPRPARAEPGSVVGAPVSAALLRPLGRTVDVVSRCSRARATSATGARDRAVPSLKLQRPLFLEGEPGVGKTELAKTLARALETLLLRVQCYEGLDIAQTAYEWNVARQMIEIRLAEAAHGVERRRRPRAPRKSLYARSMLIERPLLQALTQRARRCC